jgi:chemotaxis signal transduction protein
MNLARIPSPRTARADGMRADFDSAFSRAPKPADAELEDILALRLGDERCLVRLSDIAGVIAGPLLTAVPTSAPALLGITSNHGSVVAAYDLAILLGRAPTPPRWMVITAAEPSLGLTFEHFDGYQRISRGLADSVLVVAMTSVIATIRALASPPGQALNAQHRSGD